MTEQERIDKINAAAVKHLEDILMSLENEEVDGDGLMAITYAHLIASCLAGYSPETMVDDAKNAAEKLTNMVEEPEDAPE